MCFARVRRQPRPTLRAASYRRSICASPINSSLRIVSERASQLASRLFKAAGSAGIYTDQPFGRIYADITTGRQHLSNQFEITGRTYGATLFGIEGNKDFVL
jgi:hypothetical protein